MLSRLRPTALAAAALASCGESWHPMEMPAVRPTDPLPTVVEEHPGRGPVVRFGALVQADIEVLTPSPARPSDRPSTRRAWLWTGYAPGDLGNDARFLAVERTIGSEMVVDTRSPVAGRAAPVYRSVFLYDRPYGDYRNALNVHDTVFRVRRLEACPARLWYAQVSNTSFGFETGCKGDFIPTSCSPRLWHTVKAIRYRLTADCGGEALDFRSQIPADVGQ